jgi:hypothetical protein
MRRLFIPLLSVVSLACQPKGATTPPAVPAASETASPSNPPQIDGARLFGVVEHLASDELGGRYTLSPDIFVAADYLAKAFEEAGVAPVGTSYRHEFDLVTGARTPTPPSLTIGKPGTGRAVTAAQFAPYASSPSGKVEGEIVFVGYAARSSDDAHVYDDLAGIDLTGKVAMVLMHQPRSPDVRALFSAMRERRVAFEAEAAPLRAKGDDAALAKLHARATAEILELASPWVPTKKITAEERASLQPTDPKADLDTMKIAGVLSRAGERDAPAFDGFGRLSEKVDRLAAAGATAVIVVEGPRSFVDAAAKKADELPALTGGRPQSKVYPIPVVRMKHTAADALVRAGGKKPSQLQKKIDTSLAPASAPTGLVATLDLQLSPIVNAVPNILATIPGTDLAHEIVMFGAHYDHIGRDEEGGGDCHGRTLADGQTDGVCNGADDNASGTAVVVEIARSMAAAGYQPRRSIVFALFSGEEMGLLGSKAMAAAMPTEGPFAGGKVVSMVNIDMVGRLRDEGLAIGGVASGDNWMKILDEVGTFGMPILYDRAITTRSDHAAFYEQNIPVLFLFTHTHPDYHAPGDEFAQINREGLTDIARLVEGVAIRLGDGQAIAFAPPKTPAEGLTRALPGSNPETVEKRVPAVAASEPAAAVPANPTP